MASSHADGISSHMDVVSSHAGVTPMHVDVVSSHVDVTSTHADVVSHRGYSDAVGAAGAFSPVFSEVVDEGETGALLRSVNGFLAG